MRGSWNAIVVWITRVQLRVVSRIVGGCLHRDLFVARESSCAKPEVISGSSAISIRREQRGVGKKTQPRTLCEIRDLRFHIREGALSHPQTIDILMQEIGFILAPTHHRLHASCQSLTRHKPLSSGDG